MKDLCAMVDFSMKYGKLASVNLFFLSISSAVFALLSLVKTIHDFFSGSLVMEKHSKFILIYRAIDPSDFYVMELKRIVAIMFCGYLSIYFFRKFIYFSKNRK